MEDEKYFYFRSNLLLGIFVLCLACFAGVLYNAQIVNGSSYLARSTTQVTTSETVETFRGIIKDRNGKVLVSNREIYSVTFDPDEVPKSSDPDVSHDRAVALALLRLIRLCQDQGVTWTDNLPVTAEDPYTYTIKDAGDTQRSRFQKFLKEMKWSDMELSEHTTQPLMTPSLRKDLALESSALTCSILLDQMRKKFDLPATFTDQEVRLVSGVLYELRLRKLSNKPVTIPYVFAEDVTPEFISLLNDGAFSGAVVSSTSVRLYNTDYAAHILGRVGAIQDKEERDALNEPYNTAKEAGKDTTGIRYYYMDDKVGRNGVEKAFETYLAGLDGTRLITTDRNGKKTSELYSVEPQPGATVSLTLDIDFQAQVEAALAATVQRMNADDAAKNPDDPKNGTRGAAAAVVSVADSGILALATYPTYSQRTYLEDQAALAADPAAPFVNRALTGYAPGSTFKPMMAVAALEEGAISSPTEKLRVPGYWTYPDMIAGTEPFTRYCWNRVDHGRLNVSQALTESCNVFFYEMGYRLGIEKMNEYARAFGLGEPTGIEIDEKLGTLAGPEEREAKGEIWYGGDTIAAAIGQSDNLFTPLQMANYIATLVRGGDRLSAHLLNTVTAYDGSKTILDYEPQVLSTVEMSDSTLAAVKKGMGDLVTSGSVSSYFRSCIVSAGAKTGSIQLGNNQTNGAFVCFAPFENPEIAVAVVIERGGSGAALASTAVEILNAYFAESDIGTAFIPEGTLLP